MHIVNVRCCGHYLESIVACLFLVRQKKLLGSFSHDTLKPVQTKYSRGLGVSILLLLWGFFLVQSGQLNEYTERKQMSADVSCMALGSVPAGEQRCRFLAVGLNDDTVRIISLDPQVLLVVVFAN